jgi:hypothetical protein
LTAVKFPKIARCDLQLGEWADSVDESWKTEGRWKAQVGKARIERDLRKDLQRIFVEKSRADNLGHTATDAGRI